jgi:hypothetical protein
MQIEMGILGEPVEIVLLRRARNRAFLGLQLAFCLTSVMGIISLMLGLTGRTEKVCPGEGNLDGLRLLENHHCLLSDCGKEFRYYPVRLTYNISALVCGLYCDTQAALQDALKELPDVPDKSWSDLMLGGIIFTAMLSGMSCMLLLKFSLDALIVSHKIKRKASEAPLQIPLLPKAPRDSGDSIGTHSAFDAAPCGSDV